MVMVRRNRPIVVLVMDVNANLAVLHTKTSHMVEYMDMIVNKVYASFLSPRFIYVRAWFVGF